MKIVVYQKVVKQSWIGSPADMWRNIIPDIISKFNGSNTQGICSVQRIDEEY